MNDDLISRQKVLDELNSDAELLRRALDDTDVVMNEREKFRWGLGLIESYIYVFEGLPTEQPEFTEQDMRDEFNSGYICGMEAAHPEPLIDKEQRIFLAAMEREEKVCEEVDGNYVREPYEDSLVSVCKEIKRKVKGALWTI